MFSQERREQPPELVLLGTALWDGLGVIRFIEERVLGTP